MSNDNLEDLQGQIERLTYVNDENNFTVAKVRVAGRHDLVTAVGNILNPIPGEIIKMHGEWGGHPKFGEQFKIVFCETVTPATVQGMEKYLASGMIKGIGPVMSKRIVRKFKEETLNIIEKEIGKLTQVTGIGAKRIAMIEQAWSEQKEIRSVMLFLHSQGVSSGYAAKIYRQYGNDAIRVIQQNPYRLAEDILGIGFITADKIAQKLGFGKDSELRAAAGILYVLHELTAEGHVYYPFGQLIEKSEKILDTDRAVIIKAMGGLAADGQIVIEALAGSAAELPEEDRAVYLTGYYTAERNLARRLKILIDTPPAIRQIDSGKAVEWIEAQLAITLAARQVEAIRASAENKVLIITGGPGTGKTTIIEAIVKIFSALRAMLVLTAPTGRAAKRMSETTGREATTIHRLLEYNFRRGGFQKNEASPLDCQLLILDEASMVDTLLMHHLLLAMPATCTLIMVGDVNQLPSVGAGNVLRDIIDSGIAPVVELKEIFRQAKESSIIINAHNINEGRMPVLVSSPGKIEDFYFIEQEDPEKALALIIQLVRDRIPERFGLDPLKDIQVLTPMHRGNVGAANLNVELQKALNPGEHGIVRRGRNFRVRDKVMQITNNYHKEIYNGDIGIITALDEETQEVAVQIDDREVIYDFCDLDELIHAYAVSIHKAQGSEYPAVVMPILTQHYLLLQRNLLYTGITRGKKLVVIVGTRKAIAIAVKNNKTEKRHTLLKTRLRLL